MVLAYNLSKSFAERIILYLLMAKDKQKDLFITKAKNLNTCELKTLDKKKNLNKKTWSAKILLKLH
jgi:hypothetical protein